MNRPPLIGIAPVLVVKDVVKTVQYYTEVLGFRLINYFMDPPVYGIVQRDGYQIHFGKSKSDEIKTNEEIRKGTPDLIIWVPEIDAFYDEVQSKGAEIVEGIVRRVYGSREFLIRDCDGHVILVGD